MPERFALKKILYLLMIFIAVCFVTESKAQIAFVANINGNWDLVVSEDDGSNPNQLTKTAFDERDPCWTSDKTQLVYSTSDGQLNIINVDGSQQAHVASTSQLYPKITPSLSPDGKHIAFAQFRPPEEKDDTDLKLFNFETKQIRIHHDQYAIQMWPAWSPGGERIVYANMQCSSQCGRLIQELWISDADGKWSRQLLLTHALCQQPDWSQDGQRIAYSSDQSGNFDIWIFNLEKWKTEQITFDEGLDVHPSWSDDGKRIAFISTRSGSMEIWIKEIRTGKLKRLQPFGSNQVQCKDVAW